MSLSGPQLETSTIVNTDVDTVGCLGLESSMLLIGVIQRCHGLRSSPGPSGTENLVLNV